MTFQYVAFEFAPDNRNSTIPMKTMIKARIDNVNLRSKTALTSISMETMINVNGIFNPELLLQRALLFWSKVDYAKSLADLRARKSAQF